MSGFARFVERMAFLSRGVKQGGFAGADGAEQSEHLAQADFRTHVTEDGGAPSAFGLLLRPRGTVVGMSSGDFREDRRPVWDGHAKARAS